METSYKKDDVEILLKNINGLVAPEDVVEREKRIQEGGHYSEMLPIEYKPSDEYMNMYKMSLVDYGVDVAVAVAVVSEKILKKRGENVILVSLARAGIPAGILIKRYIKKFFNIDIGHYAISIIRYRGIDRIAIEHILKQHKAEDILFVDGWIGKGAILNQLREAMLDYPAISPELAVIADPAHLVELSGTYDDILIPSSCLNCTVSGLISRTFLRSDIILENDFHGALYYKDMENEDVSYDFIDSIEKHFDIAKTKITDIKLPLGDTGVDEVKKIALEFGISNINYIKPSIGETTRVLLRRVPWKVLINEDYRGDSTIQHILKLAEEKGVEIVYYPLKCYKACGLIRKMADV